MLVLAAIAGMLAGTEGIVAVCLDGEVEQCFLSMQKLARLRVRNEVHASFSTQILIRTTVA